MHNETISAGELPHMHSPEPAQVRKQGLSNLLVMLSEVGQHIQEEIL